MKRLLYVSFFLVASTSFASAQAPANKATNVQGERVKAASKSSVRTPAEQKAFEAKKIEMDKKGTSTLKATKVEKALIDPRAKQQ